MHPSSGAGSAGRSSQSFKRTTSSRKTSSPIRKSGSMSSVARSTKTAESSEKVLLKYFWWMWFFSLLCELLPYSYLPRCPVVFSRPLCNDIMITLFSFCQ
eukprot:GHVO01021211.1.p1 GENE.GHVO01021211.1~~GHVO01021211.1.p1  ORF type:complete len:100 (+),score=4.45 GHVO01021211.1:3-302(+)